jgi:hypothetical protein
VDTTSDPANCGACGHSCNGGACRNSLCQPVVVANSQARPFAVTVDAAHVYWTDVNDDTVKRAGLSGGGPENVATNQTSPTGIAVDELGAYWLNYGDGSVNRGLPGQNPTQITIGPTGAVALAKDATDLFWITDDSSGNVLTAPRSGASGPGTLASNVASGVDVALDGTHVYFTVGGGGFLGGGGEIWRVAKDGRSNAERLIGNQSDPGGIAVFGGLVYWCNRGSGNVRSIPVTGGLFSTLVAGNQNMPFAVAVDSSGIYWVNYNDGAVMQLPAGQSTPRPRLLAQGPTTARDLALDATSVYWITEGDQTQANGTVMAVVKPAP